MSENTFRCLTTEAKDLYEQNLSRTGSQISDMCFNSRIAWSPGFQYKITTIADTLCMVSDGGLYTTPHLVMPVGYCDEDVMRTVADRLYPLFHRQGWAFRIMYIDQHRLPVVQALEEHGYVVETGYNPDYSDYVYDAESLRTLSGKALHAKRNHINRFRREYPDHEYRTIRAEDGPECLQLVMDWTLEKGIDPENLCDSDYVPIRRLFRYFDRLDIAGGTIRIDGRIRAFAMGTRLPDGNGVLHFEKADTNYRGLYTMINYAVANNEFPDAEWINREEDLGIDGLRKAKSSYLPISMTDKYFAVIRRP